MALSSAASVSLAGTLSAALDLGRASFPFGLAKSVSLADGTGAGKADRVFTDTRTLAASASEDLDLAGVLTDAFGASITFAKVKALMVVAAAANSNNVIVGGASSNGFISWVGGATHTVTVRPGGALALLAGETDATGYAVTAGTADLLKIANSGAGSSVTYSVAILGTSA
ncbi:hypothetical protein [Streptomyces lavendulocolor]|jgi:hypothetical protein|uniref:hypothetical protein n=1 Tax=Streptomyces lavendulocolor TaxID=67316 RepID=UPI003C2B67D9